MNIFAPVLEGARPLHREGQTQASFDISAPLTSADEMRDQRGIIGWAKLAQVTVPVIERGDSTDVERFHILGATEDTNPVPESIRPFRESSRLQTIVRAGSIAIIDNASLADLTRRSGMTLDEIMQEEADIAAGIIKGREPVATRNGVPVGVKAVHAVFGKGPQAIHVGRNRVGRSDMAFAELLDRGDEDSLASRDHFTAHILRLSSVELRIHSTNGTGVEYMSTDRPALPARTLPL